MRLLLSRAEDLKLADQICTHWFAQRLRPASDILLRHCLCLSDRALRCLRIPRRIDPGMLRDRQMDVAQGSFPLVCPLLFCGYELTLGRGSILHTRWDQRLTRMSFPKHTICSRRRRRYAYKGAPSHCDLRSSVSENACRYGRGAVTPSSPTLYILSNGERGA